MPLKVQVGHENDQRPRIVTLYPLKNLLLELGGPGFWLTDGRLCWVTNIHDQHLERNDSKPVRSQESWGVAICVVRASNKKDDASENFDESGQ